MLAYLSKQEEQVGKAGREEKQRELGGQRKRGDGRRGAKKPGDQEIRIAKMAGLYRNQRCWEGGWRV